MKKNILVIFLIFSMMLALPVCAEIYKYVDENGQKRWTDDLSQVPKEQRPAVQRLESTPESSVDETADVSQKNQTSPPLEGEPADLNAGDPGQAADLSREALEKEKADLDSRYEQLLEERKQLEEMKSTELSTAAQSELNRRISAYNEKTEQYESQLNQFNQRINDYNQLIMSTPPPKSE